MKVIVSAPYAMPLRDEYRLRLERAGCEVVFAEVRERLGEDELKSLLKDADGIICGDDRITRAVLESAPRLKVISKWGTGIDSIDLLAAAERGIPVMNTPGAFSDPVADTAMGYVLLQARKLAAMDLDLHAGVWNKLPLSSLSELTLGIVGVGNCGKAVARRAAAFGMTLLGNDRVDMPPDFLAAAGIEMTTLEELLRRSDFVTLHPDLNPTSRGLIDARALALMKPTAFLINTSRGPVVDESALVQALSGGRLAGAALDVFEVEPLPSGHPLTGLANCFLGPHNANSSAKAHRRVHDATITNLLRVLGLADA